MNCMGKIAASVLLKLFINNNDKFHIKQNFYINNNDSALIQYVKNERHCPRKFVPWQVFGSLKTLKYHEIFLR